MVLALAAQLSRPTARLLTASLVGRRRPRNPYARRDWLRVSQRLASGMTPQAIAWAEGTDAAAVEDLLQRDEFRRLVDSFAELLARPAEAQRARLVRLARIALENALGDWDVGAALFVLEEDARGRDPAETLASGILARGRGTAAPAPAPSRAAPAPASPSGPGAYDPLTGLVRRGAATLRRAIVEEHALQDAARAATERGGPAAAPTSSSAGQAPRATAAADATPAPAAPARPVASTAATTGEAAWHALALAQAARSSQQGREARPASPADRLARRLGGQAAASVLLPVAAREAPPAHPPLLGLPRRPRAP
jgi:hypothetical protein